MRGLLFFRLVLTFLLCPLMFFEAYGNGMQGSMQNLPNYITDTLSHRREIDSIVVTASSLKISEPIALTTVSENVLKRESPINSLPMALSLQPSVVVSSQAGTGLGYSNISIRGSKGAHVNVSLNGITLNDSESQEVFWANIPALSTVLSQVQLQRGLGTTSLGSSSAFGASINMGTSHLSLSPSVYASISSGSYNTSVASLYFSSPVLKSGLYFKGAYSVGKTDGYIKNTKADVQSIFAVLAYLKGNNSFKLTYLSGEQHSGISWKGCPLAYYQIDRRYNPAGLYPDKFGNMLYYDKETDNYIQHHLQLHYSHYFDRVNTLWSTTINYTKGDGYYEQYRHQASLSKYGLPKTFKKYFPYTKKDSVFKKSDLITRKAMDNHYVVITSDLKYNAEKFTLASGLYLSTYMGKHFGKVIFSDVLGKDYDYASVDWYENNSWKSEVNAFFRGEYEITNYVHSYLDLQYRGIFLDMKGLDDKMKKLDFDRNWHFVNPRLGFNYYFDKKKKHKSYFALSLAHREPNRADLKENIKSLHKEKESGKIDAQVSLKAEKMLDVELGYSFNNKLIAFNANCYFMEYFDMLLNTGRLSSVGYPIRENVDRGFRRGLELSFVLNALKQLTISGNTGLSINKILDYTSYYSVYDNERDYKLEKVEQEKIGNTSILMSPSHVSMLNIALKPFQFGRNRRSENSFGSNLKDFSISLNGKFVGSQYWDNTSSDDRKIPAYFVLDLEINQDIRLRNSSCLSFSVYVNNLLNHKYYNDVWVYREFFRDSNKMKQEEGLFPQAPLNYMFKLSFRF